MYAGGQTLQRTSCFILLAGTNVIAAGESHNIDNRLEESVTARLSSADVILATIPYRHDMPVSHPVNQRTILAKFYIEVSSSSISIIAEGLVTATGLSELSLTQPAALPAAVIACEPPASPAACQTGVIKVTSPVHLKKNIRFPLKKKPRAHYE